MKRARATPAKALRIHCDGCKKSYVADDVALHLIAHWRKRRMRLGRLTCSRCDHNGDFDVRTSTIRRDEPEGIPAHFMCPVSGCSGFALPVARGRKFACVDCGGGWESEVELFQSIARIVKRYRHRKRVYVKRADGFEPVPFAKQPDDWQDLVGERETIEDPPEPSRKKRSETATKTEKRKRSLR